MRLFFSFLLKVIWVFSKGEMRAKHAIALTVELDGNP